MDKPAFLNSAFIIYICKKIMCQPEILCPFYVKFAGFMELVVIICTYTVIITQIRQGFFTYQKYRLGVRCERCNNS